MFPACHATLAVQGSRPAIGHVAALTGNTTWSTDDWPQ
ncbi:UNVERIFIED_ORG: hypothetical protein ABIC54_006704 [Burkholderia sp. 1263]